MQAYNIHHPGPDNPIVPAATPPETSPASSQPFPFLKLPLELRRRVYRCLLPDRVPAQWTRMHDASGTPSINRPLKVNGDRSYPEILRLNHFVHAEAEESLYDFANFAIKFHPTWGSYFLDEIVLLEYGYPSQLRKVKSMTIDISLDFEHPRPPNGVYITRGDDDASRNLKNHIHHLMNNLRCGTRLKRLTVECYWPSTKRPSPREFQEISVSLRWLLEPLRELRGLVKAEIKVLKGLPTDDTRVDALEDKPGDTQLEQDSKRYLRKGLRNIALDVCGHTAVTTPPSLLDMWLGFVEWERYRAVDEYHERGHAARLSALRNIVWTAHDHGDTKKFMATVNVMRAISKEVYEERAICEALAEREYGRLLELAVKSRNGRLWDRYLPIDWKTNTVKDVMVLIRSAGECAVGVGACMVLLRMEILCAYDERAESYAMGLWIGVFISHLMVWHKGRTQDSRWT